MEFPINLFGEGMGIMLPDSEISLLSLKRLQCLKDVNIFPWFKRQQNLLRLVVSYNICKIQSMFHLFTSLIFSYCTNEIQLTSTFITQFKYKIVISKRNDMKMISHVYRAGKNSGLFAQDK